MSEQELKDRFKKWAIEVVLFTRMFPKTEEAYVIKRQLIRSSTSSAANYRAACRGKSPADFINKLRIVEEELDESMFWIEFISDLEPNLKESIAPLHKEANELLSIVVASIKTIKNKIK